MKFFGKQIKLNPIQNTFLKYTQTLRIHQWIKNVLVFVPMLAAHQITTLNLKYSFYAFFSFCLIASSVYIINDLLDLKADRSHPYKKLRPFASGKISVKNGMAIFFVLFFLGNTMSLFVGLEFFFLVSTYWMLAFIYSLVLKKIVILDIIILGVLYTLRIVGGSFATEIQISFWLFAFSIFLFLSLAAVKRQSELVELKKRKKFKTIGRGYNINDLTLVTTISLSAGFISVLIVGLYINSPDVLNLYSKPWTLGLSCLVLLFWIMKMVFASSRGLIHLDPIVYALKDSISRLCFLAILFLIMINFVEWF